MLCFYWNCPFKYDISMLGRKGGGGRGQVPWLEIFYQHHVIFKVLWPPWQRLKKEIILSQSISLSSLSPKIYAVVMLLKVSSMAMYKPPSQSIKNISPFHHIDVLSALYTHVLFYSVQALFLFHHL